MTAMTARTWQESIVALTQAHQALSLAAYALPPHVRGQAGVCGAWSPHQVLAHAEAWNNEAVARFAAFQSGQTDDKQYDTDAFNAEAVAARAEMTWDEQLAAMDASLAALVQAATDAPANLVASDGRYQEWLQSRAADYREHAAQFEVWTTTGLANI